MNPRSEESFHHPVPTKQQGRDLRNRERLVIVSIRFNNGSRITHKPTPLIERCRQHRSAGLPLRKAGQVSVAPDLMGVNDPVSGQRMVDSAATN